jgi:sortase A
MRRGVRLLGTLMIVAGVLTLGWAVLVWQWQDPFTAAYTKWEQHRLASQLDREMTRFASHDDAPSLAALRVEVAKDAATYRKSLHRGDAIGRLTIGSLGLKIILVQGTDHESLKKGPGHYAGSALPGQGRLVYIAGHRTTYLAPFSHIDSMRVGDKVTLRMPYATVVYSVTGHVVVDAHDLAVLQTHNREVLALQACHPRFFATHRYIVWAKPIKVTLRNGKSFKPALTPVAAKAA